MPQTGSKLSKAKLAMSFVLLAAVIAGAFLLVPKPLREIKVIGEPTILGDNWQVEDTFLLYHDVVSELYRGPKATVEWVNRAHNVEAKSVYVLALSGQQINLYIESDKHSLKQAMASLRAPDFTYEPPYSDGSLVLHLSLLLLIEGSDGKVYTFSGRALKSGTSDASALSKQLIDIVKNEKFSLVLENFAD